MLERIVAIAEEAGRLALDHFEKRGSLPVTSKAHLNLVTEADRAVESLIASRLRAAFPDDGLFGEESGGQTGGSRRIWVVDPIDGTFNFVRGGDQWAVSIGLFENGCPVLGVIHAPVRGTMLAGGKGSAPTLNGALLAPLTPFAPDRGSIGVGLDSGAPVDEQIEVLRFLMRDARLMIRSCNSATMAMMEVATGEADVYLAMGDSSWDVMAAWPILIALGARATFGWDNVPLTAGLKFAIGKPEAVDLLAALGLGKPTMD
ncbi:myo-inositol-1(or 4)-monophosphatase [Pseudochelatococcus lubricantis]|uniref:Myo-inositol-1(Or 4)-monophosphatase n=1 Tax=Pseudochelatococcus lubricantis TaxID=1538102 RepID=A0ABX0V2N7_9HYPH|nr:inositol monophosphatase family protein [Pseudochelatococcus lubricantis]NIJ58843.1 myo-inositol-1(or 4)-monophosphatase [Pseudochelatococcus lubricantis]